MPLLAQALDDLLKPFKRSRFCEVLATAKLHIVRNTEYLRAAPDGPADLLLIKAAGRLTSTCI